MTYFLGIDGGGTRTTAVLTNEQGAELVRAEGEAGIVNVLEPEAGAHTLADFASSVLGQARVDARARVLVCALAGAGREPERTRLEQVLAAQGVAETVHVTSDFVAALEDAFGAGSGILLIAGTGSSAFARHEDGRTARAGGWGHILGDEGSGYALGLAALRRCMREYDGRERGEGWLRLVQEHTGVATAEALVHWAAAASKADIAALAPAVLEAAEQGVVSACEWVDTGGRDIALHAAALYERLKPWPTAPTVALTGGLIAPGRPLRAAAVREIDKLGLSLPILERRIDAAAGAAAMARRLAH